MRARLRPMTATTVRVSRQLVRDRRTLAIVLVAPVLLLLLLHEILGGRGALANRVETQILVIFPLLFMFLLTAVAMVRERTSGTLERLLTTPIGKGHLLTGYGLAFGGLAVVQAVVLTGVATLVLGVEVTGPLWSVILVSAVTALLGVCLGLLASAVSRSEFQAVQLFPVLVIPQILLCGLLGPREQMAGWLQTVSDWLPLTFAVEAVGAVADQATIPGAYWRDVLVIGMAVLALVVAAASTLRRRTP